MCNRIALISMKGNVHYTPSVVWIMKSSVEMMSAVEMMSSVEISTTFDKGVLSATSKSGCSLFSTTPILLKMKIKYSFL